MEIPPRDMVSVDAPQATSLIREISLDGVRYAIICHNGAEWRLGSLTPLWREELAALGEFPSEEELKGLEKRGIWLAPAAPAPPLAVMCCGLGASWPGMGRSLYENFPAARVAMDDLAALADWDLTGLMWETDPEVINRTRWQIPWLFMLEYAQWSQLRSLGLSPSLLCGHSIGELVALCLAGVYGTTSAWYLFDTRSRHMDNLESIPSAQGGMLAVSAGGEEIADTLAEWPSLHVANRNTPRQYVLSGPREPLLAARKSLRKRRIPAFMLNINLAFHNPAMRVLRGLSVRRLNGMEMREPAMTMLSCVTGSPYPHNKPAICEQIADLDENTVDWPATVRAMEEDFHIRACVELGPKEVLCGLCRELAPNMECFAADRQDNEVVAMRQLCARLFALGCLPFEAILAQKNSRGNIPPETDVEQIPAQGQSAATAADWGEDGKILIDILAREAGLNPEAVRPDMDLRHDLGLRSSRFPMLAQEMEEKLGRTIAMENLFPLVTVADLARLFLGVSTDIPSLAPARRPAHASFAPPPLVPYTIQVEHGVAALRRVYLDPLRQSLNLGPESRIALFGHGGGILPGLWISLAALGLQLAVPRARLNAFAPLQKAGATLLALECPPIPTPDEFAEALDNFNKEHGRLEGIFYAPPFLGPDIISGGSQSLAPATATFILACASHAAASGEWLRIFQGWLPPQQKETGACRDIATYNSNIAAMLARKNLDCKVINWERTNAGTRLGLATADMLALALLYGQEPFSLWRQPLHGDATTIFSPASPAFDEVFPDRNPPGEPRMDTFQGCWQISRSALPHLSSHGAETKPAPAMDGHIPHTPWAPLSLCLGAMLNSAALAMPWLKIGSLTNLRRGATVALPAGVTRECRLRARTQAWISLENVMSRICALNLDVRDISANGRHKDMYSSVCSGECVMGGKCAVVLPIWKNVPGPAGTEYSGADLNTFYGILGLQEPWRILEKISPMPSNGPNTPEYEAILRPGKCFIAAMPNWEYNNTLYMIEGIMHACAFALALDDMPEGPDATAMARTLEKWHCAGIGWVRFTGAGIPDGGRLSAQLRHSWREDDMARFEAQILTPDGECVLTMHDVEFDKAR